MDQAACILVGCVNYSNWAAPWLGSGELALPPIPNHELDRPMIGKLGVFHRAPPSGSVEWTVLELAGIDCKGSPESDLVGQ
jgi:hypothetical protein